MRFSSSLLFFSSLLVVSEAHTRARPVLQARDDYNGGWALSIPGADCPADAPVACGTNDGTVNPTCCPSGQTCFGLENPHCCPTSTDCQNVVENLPVCANSTWNMYELRLENRFFFCCEPGQFGVLPLSGYNGICEPIGQVVASSLIATSATQAGGTAATTGNTGGSPATTSAVTSTLQGGAVTTILTTIGATQTSTQTSSGASSTGGSTSSNPVTTAAKKLGISTAAIIGIAVGAVVLILAALISYWFCRKRRNTRYQAEGPMRGAPIYTAVPQPYQSQGPPEYKSPVVGYATPQQGYGGGPPPAQGYPVSPRSPQPQTYGVSPPPQGYHGPSQPPPVNAGAPAVEVPAPQRWEGRAEMGP